MRRVPTIVALLIGLTAIGCRNTGSHELLERELRLQEDKISTLQYELEKANQQLQLRSREVQVLPQETYDERSPRGDSSRGRTTPPKDAERPMPPKVEMPLGEAAPQYKGPPLIQPPDPNVPEGELPRAVAADPPARELAPNKPAPKKPAALEASSAKKLATPPAMTDRLEELAPPPGLAAPSGEVNEIALNHELTGRRAVGGAGGKDTVVVVVEPRTADGRPVQAAGAISIVVLDLTKDGPDARLARWNFSAEETAKYYRHAREGGGMQFELRWPGDPPQATGLQLFVRLTTPDGRKLVADAELTTLGAKPSARQTGQSSGTTPSGIQLMSGAEPLPKANWRRSKRPLPRPEEPALQAEAAKGIETTRMETTRAEATCTEAKLLPEEIRERRPGEPGRLPDDVVSGEGAVPLNAAIPIDASERPRDARAWAPYR